MVFGLFDENHQDGALHYMALDLLWGVVYRLMVVVDSVSIVSMNQDRYMIKMEEKDMVSGYVFGGHDRIKQKDPKQSND